MILQAYTALHVIISLVAIAAGVPVVAGLLQGRPRTRWTSVFLWTTTATSLTGFGFPFARLLPSHIVGALSLVVLAVAAYALSPRRGWRRTYATTAVIALYFNVFVLIVQLFQKVPSLKALAPAQTEPPFVTTQLLVLSVFVALGITAVLKSLRPAGLGQA